VQPRSHLKKQFPSFEAFRMKLCLLLHSCLLVAEMEDTIVSCFSTKLSCILHLSTTKPWIFGVKYLYAFINTVL